LLLDNQKHYKSLQEEFKNEFRNTADFELIERFNNEVGKTVWVSARGFFLFELGKEFDRRNWDWSVIRNESGGFNLSEGNKVYLKNNKLFLIADQIDNR
jgi:hypothetical protein